MPWLARAIVQRQYARRAGCPQLTRGPLGSVSMPSTSSGTVAVLALASGVFALGPAQSPSQVPCRGTRAGPLRVSPDSIGPLSVRWTLGLIRERCPSVRDTVHYGEATESGGNIYPAIVLSFIDVTVLGIQWAEAADPHRPIDGWIVYGANAVLPGGTPFAATYGVRCTIRTERASRTSIMTVLG